MNMTRIYRALLRLYPREYRTLFAKEMFSAFEDACSEYRRRGFYEFSRFGAAELLGLVVEAEAQWVAKTKHVVFHSRNSGDCCCLPDIARARPPWVARDTYYQNLARVLPCSSDTSQ